MSEPQIRMTPGGGMEAIGHGENWECVPRDAQAEIERLGAAARDAVLSYLETNPMRTADMHSEKCGCLRCEIDRLDHVSDRYR